MRQNSQAYVNRTYVLSSLSRVIKSDSSEVHGRRVRVDPVFVLLATTQINGLLELEFTIQRFRTLVKPTLHYTNTVMLYENPAQLIIKIQAYIPSLNRNM